MFQLWNPIIHSIKNTRTIVAWGALCVLVRFCPFTSDWVSKDDWSNGSFQVLLLFQVPVCRRGWLLCDQEQRDPAVPGAHYYCATGTWDLQRAHGTRICKKKKRVFEGQDFQLDWRGSERRVMKRPNCNTAKPLQPRCVSCRETEQFNETMSEIKKKNTFPSVSALWTFSGVCEHPNDCWRNVVALIVNGNLSTIVNIQCAALLCLRLSSSVYLFFLQTALNITA